MNLARNMNIHLLASTADHLKNSLLPAHPLVSTSIASRIANKFGGAFPDGVADPINTQQVRSLFQYAQQHQAKIVVCRNSSWYTPFVAGGRPILLINIANLMFFDLDEHNGMVSFGVGISAVDLEIKLRAKGFSLGHFSQLVDYPTLCDLASEVRDKDVLAAGFGVSSFLIGAVFASPNDIWVVSAASMIPESEDLYQALYFGGDLPAILTQVTVRVTPINMLTTQRLAPSVTANKGDEGEAEFMLWEKQFAPLNKSAQRFLSDLEKSEYQSLMIQLHDAIGQSRDHFNWGEYCIDIVPSEDEAAIYSVKIAAQKVGSSAWLQTKFGLTARESKVCYLLLRGRTDKDTARLLNLSYWTVRTHVSNILRKFGVSSRNEIGVIILDAITQQ
ncbi:FAD-binding protein [Sapientia aquatica]|uniref:FAD-binding protein n=2 Tax=Sapientia aquatica TaxID=1549640 RepID=A0A4R5VXK2_9BURK|nr:FAD-binding protein [Sapientia aquatica]